MRDVIISLPAELLEEVEQLARQEERTRRAQLRHLIRLGLEVAKARRRGLRGAGAAGDKQEHQPHKAGGEADA